MPSSSGTLLVALSNTFDLYEPVVFACLEYQIAFIAGRSERSCFQLLSWLCGDTSNSKLLVPLVCLPFDFIIARMNLPRAAFLCTYSPWNSCGLQFNAYPCRVYA